MLEYLARWTAGGRSDPPRRMRSGSVMMPPNSPSGNRGRIAEQVAVDDGGACENGIDNRVHVVFLPK